MVVVRLTEFPAASTTEKWVVEGPSRSRATAGVGVARVESGVFRNRAPWALLRSRTVGLVTNAGSPDVSLDVRPAHRFRLAVQQRGRAERRHAREPLHLIQDHRQ